VSFYSYQQVALERTLLEVFHDIYDKVLLILSRLPQSPTHEMMSVEKEVVDFELANRKESAVVGRTHGDTTITSPVRNTTLVDGKITYDKQPRISKSSNLQQNILNKDVLDVLSLVQAGSIMERVSSVHSKSKK
jgi:hypothetical protein